MEHTDEIFRLITEQEYWKYVSSLSLVKMTIRESNDVCFNGKKIKNQESNTYWTEEFLENYKDSLNWRILSQNVDLPWSKALIIKFETYWNYSFLTDIIIERFFDDSEIEELICLYKDKLNWDIICDSGIITDTIILKCIDKINWKILSGNHFRRNWTLFSIERFQNEIDWSIFSSKMTSRSILPINSNDCRENENSFGLDFLQKYKDKLNWNELSRNIYIIFTIEMLAEFRESWNWLFLKYNYAITWSSKHIELFLQYIPSEHEKVGLSQIDAYLLSELCIERNIFNLPLNKAKKRYTQKYIEYDVYIKNLLDRL